MSDRRLNEMEDQAKTNVRVENTSKEEVLYGRNDSEKSNKSIEIRNYIRCAIEVTSMTLADNKMVWVMSYRSPTMYLYNDEGKVVRLLTVEGTTGIKDMVITKSGDMIVTCKGKKVMRVSKNDGKTVLRYTTLIDCEGVCLNDKEEIIVCMRGGNGENHVAVYSADGKREIRGRVAQGGQRIDKPYRVVQNGEDLCVVNQGKNVVCVDKSDNVRWVYKDKQTKSDKPFNPQGICVDQISNLLVSDYYNRVYQINRDGKLLKLIQTDLEPQKDVLFEFYWGICVDDTGQVWIGNDKKEIVIIANI